MNPASFEVDKQGRSELHYAAADGNIGKLKELLACGAAINLQDKNGWTALHFAARASSPECTAELLKAGASVSLTDSFGNCALSGAVFSSQGNGAVILLLREAGADPFAKNKHGVSPFSLAHSIANFDVAQFFSDIK